MQLQPEPELVTESQSPAHAQILHGGEFGLLVFGIQIDGLSVFPYPGHIAEFHRGAAMQEKPAAMCQPPLDGKIKRDFATRVKNASSLPLRAGNHGLGRTHMVQQFHLQSETGMEIKKNKTAYRSPRSGLHIDHFRRNAREKKARNAGFGFYPPGNQAYRIVSLSSRLRGKTKDEAAKNGYQSMSFPAFHSHATLLA